MADNYVQIKIKATDTAKPDLTALKTDLDELAAKTASAKVSVDDVAAVATLKDVNARIAVLNRRLASPRITVTGAARAEAEIALLNRKLDELDGKDVSTLRSRLMALAGTASSVSGLGDAFSLFNKDASMGSKVMSGFSLATGLLEAPMSGLIVGVGGLAAGVASAGIGLGVFGAVAKSAYSQVSGAVTAYGTALSTTGKASKTAMSQYKADMAALTPPQRAFAVAITSVQQAWQGFVAQNTSGVTKILNQGMGLLPAILARMQPFLAPVEKALGGIITQMGKGIDSSGFKSFIDTMAKASGPMITNLAGAIGHVVVGIGGILKAFMPMASTMTGGLDKITAKFAHWGSTLTQHSGFQSLVAMAKADMPYVLTIVKNLGGAIKNLGGSLTGLSTFSNSKALLELATPLSQLVNWLSKANPALLRMGLYGLAGAAAGKKMFGAFSGAKSFLGDLDKGVSKFGQWGGAAKDAGLKANIAAGFTKVWKGAMAALDIVMDANPIVLIAIAIALLIGAIILLVLKCKPFRQFWISMWGDVEKAASKAWNFLDKSVFKPIQKGVDALVSFVKAHWKTLATILATVLLGPVGGLVVFLATHWKTVVRDVQTCVNTVKSWFEKLPGMVMSAIDKLPSLLFNAGAHIISMFANGIKSAIGDVTGAVGSIVSEVKSFLPFSPAKKGPLSGAGAPGLSGLSIGRQLAQGLTGSTSVVSAAAGWVARAASVGGTGTAAGSAGVAGGGKLQLELVGSDSKFMTALMGQVRITGGDPAMFQKKVAYR